MECRMVFGVFLVLIGTALCGGGQTDTPPDWVGAGKPVKASEIPEKDYGYLSGWLDENSYPPEQYFINLFAKHQIVIFGERHNIKEHKDFIIKLVPQLYHEAGVRCIGWEVSRYCDNERLNKLVTAEQFDRDGALQFARDQIAHEWNSKEHWDLIEAIWRLNKGLAPNQEKMSLVGIDMDLDFPKVFIVVGTASRDSSEFKEAVSEVLKRDETMAEQVEKQIIARGIKGLVFVGRCHDFTHYEPPTGVNFGSTAAMGNILYRKYGDRVFQVWPDSGFLSPIIEEVMKLRGHQRTAFDLYASPFANILGTGKHNIPEVPLSQIARGYIYFGPKDSLHANTPIRGFVTDDMFKKYKRYYEIDFDQTFNTATEVDEYLQAHRWPEP